MVTFVQYNNLQSKMLMDAVAFYGESTDEDLRLLRELPYQRIRICRCLLVSAGRIRNARRLH
jgi:hypothetical protein